MKLVLSSFGNGLGRDIKKIVSHQLMRKYCVLDIPSLKKIVQNYEWHVLKFANLKRVTDMYRFIFYATLTFSYIVVFGGGGAYYKKGRFMHLYDKYYAAEYDIA